MARKVAKKKKKLKKKITAKKLRKKVLVVKKKAAKKIIKKAAKKIKPKKKVALKKKIAKKVKPKKKPASAKAQARRRKVKVVLKARPKIAKKKKPVVKKKIILKKKSAIENVAVIKKPDLIKSAKPAKKEPVLHESVGALFKAKIRVVGIGGGGGSIVSEIGKSLEKTTFVIADTDIRALKKRTGIKYFWFGKELTHGLGTGVNPELAKTAAEAEKEKIKELFLDQDIVILIASLGGGLGSGATQVFAEAAKSFGGITFGIFTLPFRFEGKNKARIAQKALKELKDMLNVSITIPNERIFKIIDANTPITDAFSTVNKNLIESLESLIDLIYNPGVINIDFADLRTILKGRGNSAFLNTVEESGKDRAEKIAEKVLVNPLYQTSNFEAEKILFNISGGQNLSMFEVERISSAIGDKNPKAKIIFGISKNPKLKNKIKTTILMTGCGKEEEAEKAASEVIEEKPEPIKTLKKKNHPVIRQGGLSNDRAKIKKEKAKTSPSFIPVFNKTPIENTAVKLSAIEVPAKKAIRRNALEVKKAQELEENKRIDQEKEWEIPAFLRRVKFKS